MGFANVFHRQRFALTVVGFRFLKSHIFGIPTIKYYRLNDTGVEWVEMHKLAERVELEELKKCGILHGDVEDMMKVI